MIGIVCISHGQFAEGLLDAVALIMGPQENVKAVSLIEGMELELFKTQVDEAVTAANKGQGVLVYVDLFGATPFNTTGALLKTWLENDIDVRVITGMNLAMTVETIAMREALSLDELYQTALTTGKESVVELRETLGI